jgi:tRNA(Ile)-lysidine synthase
MLLAPLAGRKGIGLAVSGGPDSLALLDCVGRWRARQSASPPVSVFTVDHGLRPGSAGEALQVAAIAAGRGLPHRTLRWEGAKPSAGIEEAAREARYRLLNEAARAAGADCIVTAHHRDDQAETMLMRLGRGSSLTGLAGMRAARPLSDGIVLLRPLLGVAKARLVATTIAAGLAAASDESNHDRRFARTRLRALLPALAEEGVTPEGLARTADRLGGADAALDHYASELIGRAVSVDRLAVVRIEREALAAAPEEVRLRLLAKVIGLIGGADWPPRTEKLEALAQAAASAAGFRRTLGGEVVEAGKAGIVAYREAGRADWADIAVTPGFSGLWDRRFAVRVEAAAGSGVVLGPLRDAGRIAIGAVGTGFPAAPLASLPAFRKAGKVIAVPALDYADPDAPDFAATTRCVVPLPAAELTAFRGA